MSIDELMQDRYKVIADYPNGPFEIGQILLQDLNTVGEVYVLQAEVGERFNSNWIDKDAVSEYPHLFKKLQWWEERKVEDMPEYVKCIKTPDQTIMPNEVLKVTWPQDGCGRDEQGRWVFPYTESFLPATKAEYLAYQSSLK